MSEGLRLDKWLWHARFAKTRSLAAHLIEAGAVRLEDRAVKPAHIVRVGNRIALRLGRGGPRIVEICSLGERRGPAAEARLLYAERGAPAAPALPAWVSLIEDEV